MLEYSVIYHRSLHQKIGSGVIAVPDDAATPLEDATDQARAHADEIGAVFFVLEMIPPIGTTRVVWVSSPTEGPY